LGDCPALLVSDYECTNHVDLSADSEYTLALGEDLRACLDPDLLTGLPEYFEATDEGNCHCSTCRKVMASVAGGTTGQGKITYQCCWDGTGKYSAVLMVSRIINFDDVIDLGCILPDTIITDQGTLDQPITFAMVACT
jgi:hypothetical protein